MGSVSLTPASFDGQPGSPTSGEALARLSKLLLTFVVTLCALATLAPFRFSVPTHKPINWHVGAHDVLLNLLLMYPAGFLYALLRQPHTHPSAPTHRPRVVASAAVRFGGLSLVLETVQWFLPQRTTSGVDLLCNAAGAGLGALTMVALQPWVKRRIENELTLRLPLSHLFYLITILLVVDGLMARGPGVRAWLALPIACAGALIVVAVARNRTTPLGSGGLRVALLTTLWFILSTALSWGRQSSVLVVGAPFIFGFTWLAHALGLPRRARRRFEGPTLALLVLPFLLYLASLWHGYAWAAATWDLTQTEGPGGARTLAEARIQWQYDAIEALAAMTVFGYALAEAVGRKAWPTRVAPLMAGTAAAVLLCVTAWWLPHPSGGVGQPLGDGLWTPLGGAIFAAWGALVYRAELLVVLSLTRTRADASVRPA